ncbi:MAG: hypothetical protein A2X94_07175 [Bdellovibrionales bacterium GWB1_55_8]|nr:MAG: hypothetical protein A2X94_07175 [Bdellovibrionales bacterium GWB1_55_8]
MRLILLLGMVFLSCSLVFANEATEALGISAKFPGTYTLVRASGGGSQYHCDKEMELIVEPGAVRFGRESFYLESSGCHRRQGDIGPVRVSCTQFSERKISDSLTEPLTIVGYIREFTGIRQKRSNSDVIIFEHDLTQIPFGILGIWSDEEFKCVYKRKL